LERLDKGDGIEATLRAHGAQWHKKCRLRFNKKMFDQYSRAEEAKVQQSGTSVHTQAACKRSESTEPVCFFCDEPAGSAGLHEAATKQIDKKVWKHALELEDTALLAKLAAGDMIAIEAKYHKNCLSTLYNKARQATFHDSTGDEDNRLHGIAFAELVAFMEEVSSDEDNAPVFKLADLAQLYKVKLEQLGVVMESCVHTTRLKNRLLSELPDLQAHAQGKDILLSFKKDVGPALR